MARNRGFVNATPPQSGDEEDDDDTSSEGISETDSDASIKTPVKTQPTKEEDEEEEDGSETDSGSDSDSPAKPLAAKQLVEEARIVSRSKTISPESAAATPVQSVATKRPTEHSSASKEPKKMKAGDAEAEAEAEASEKKSFMMKIGEAESSETKEADEAESSEKQSVLKKADEGGPSEKKSNLLQRLWSEDGEESFAAERERDLMNGKGEEKLAGGGLGSGLGSLSVGRTTDRSMMMTGQERIGGSEEWDLLREQEIEAVMNQLKVKVRQYEQVLSYMRSTRSNGPG